MGIFDFKPGNSIDEAIEEFKKTEGSMLIDVRSEEEYVQGHIPESKNVPLPSISLVSKIIKDKKLPIYLYCHSGIRSEQAAMELEIMGYENVKNIGGIINYKGPITK